MLLAATILDAVFQPSFNITEEPCITTRDENNLEENVVGSGGTYKQTKGDVNLIYSLLWVINLVLL